MGPRLIWLAALALGLGCTDDSGATDSAVGLDATTDVHDADTEVALDAADTEVVLDTSATDTADSRDVPDAPDALDVSDTDALEVDSTADSGDTGDTGDDTDTSAPGPVMRLRALDVGQGDAFIVELPCGAMLVDTGGEVSDATAETPAFDSQDALEQQVRAFFDERPDLDHTFALVVLTHPHIDHTRGVWRLLDMIDAGELRIQNVLTNGSEAAASGASAQRALHDWADATPGVGRWYVLQRKTGATGQSNEVIDPFPSCQGVDPIITALWGQVDDNVFGWDADTLANDNNHSVVLRVDFGASSVLLTGDLEEPGIAALIAEYGASGLLDVDVYKVGHHGSHNGTTAALVDAMTPAAAVISAGPSDRVGEFTAWAYGHPRWRAVSDLLGDSDSGGVSADRPHPIDAPIATGYSGGHGTFETRAIGPAVFCTAWDGEVTLTLGSDGDLALPD